MVAGIGGAAEVRAETPGRSRRRGAEGERELEKAGSRGEGRDLMCGWSRNDHARRAPGVKSTGPVPLSGEEERAIFAMLDAAVAVAGRTSVMMALRGSRAEKVRRLGVVDRPGHGFYAGRSEEEVMARIDTCFHRGWVRFEHTRDGLPLIVYTDAGLEKAKGFVVEGWLAELRGQVEAVAAGRGLKLSFLMSECPQRNHDTVFLLVDRLAREADADWLPLLRAWSAVETKRVRARLGEVIAQLEGAG